MRTIEEVTKKSEVKFVSRLEQELEKLCGQSPFARAIIPEVMHKLYANEGTGTTVYKSRSMYFPEAFASGAIFIIGNEDGCVCTPPIKWSGRSYVSENEDIIYIKSTDIYYDHKVSKSALKTYDSITEMCHGLSNVRGV